MNRPVVVRAETCYTGTVLGWGTAFEEFDSGAVQVTVAIVEDKFGNVALVDPERLQFTDRS